MKKINWFLVITVGIAQGMALFMICFLIAGVLGNPSVAIKLWIWYIAVGILAMFFSDALRVKYVLLDKFVPGIPIFIIGVGSYIIAIIGTVSQILQPTFNYLRIF